MQETGLIAGPVSLVYELPPLRKTGARVLSVHASTISVSSVCGVVEPIPSRRERRKQAAAERKARA